MLLSVNSIICHFWASIVAQLVKNLPAKQEIQVLAAAGDQASLSSTWRRKRQPTPGPLPGKFHRWRSLGGHSPQDRKESDTLH